MPRRMSPEEYAASVVEVLVPEFPDLEDAGVAGIVERAVAAHRRSPDRTLEVILDSPLAANWRLRAATDGTATVRLSSYAYVSSEASTRKALRVNAALAAILDEAPAVTGSTRARTRLWRHK